MKKFLSALALLVICALPTFAAGVSYQQMQDWDFYGTVNNRGAVTMASTLAVTGAQTFTGATTHVSDVAVSGNLTVTGTTALTTPLTAANIQTGSAKRELTHIMLSPPTAAAVDSTTYSGIFAPNRAGTITRIGFVCAVAPTVGTDTLEALKNNTTTCLSAATFDANTLVAYTTSNATLTSTGADKALTATDVVRLKYNAGAQTVDAQAVEAVVEYEPTDF